MLHCYFSTDFNQLFEQFAQHLHAHQRQSSIWQPTPIIIPSMALGDYLQQRLTNRWQISAQLKFEFWGSYEWQSLERLAKQNSTYPNAPLSNVSMRWQLFNHLYHQAPNPDAPLKAVLQAMLFQQQAHHPITLQRLWHYSDELARVYTQYMTLRPDWLRHWQQEDCRLSQLIEPDFYKEFQTNNSLLAYYEQTHTTQHYLWRTLFAKPYAEREALRERAFAALPTQNTLSSVLYVFTPNTLLAPQLSTLLTLAQAQEILLFLRLPSTEYLPDIVDPRWLKAHTSEQHYHAGNTLVAQFGKQQRDISRLLEKFELYDAPDTPAPLPRDTLLRALQQDIISLTDTPQPYTPSAEDNSLRLTACHSFARQLETLRADIVAWLNADTSRQLSDILVVLPDLHAHQALIRAIFPADGEYDGYRLPARLTGIAESSTLELWRAITGLYACHQSGLDNSTLREWLNNPHTCASYQVSAVMMEKALDALIAAGFCRGFDAEDLKTRYQIVDGDERYTYCYALDRLLTGLLMPDAPMYENTIPSAAFALSDYAAINALCEIANQWRELSDYPLLQAGYHWLDLLTKRLYTDFAHLSHTSAYQHINTALRDLRHTLKAQNHHTLALPFSFILHQIEQHLSEQPSSSSATGSITIGRLTALRGIPYRLIALLVPDNQHFPPYTPPNRQNLITLDAPRLGDHYQEYEQQSALLDTLTQAGENFWLYYNTHDDNNTPSPAAMPVQNLLEYLNTHHPNALDYAHHHAPIEAYQAANAPLWQTIAKHLQQPNAKAPQKWCELTPLSSLPSLAQTEASQALSLEQLTDYLYKPAHYFLNQRHIATHRSISSPNPLEPLALNGLENWRLSNYLLEKDAQGLEHLPLAPVGAYGRYYSEQTRKTLTARQHALMRDYGRAQATPTQAVLYTHHSYVLSGYIPQGETLWLKPIAGSGESIKSIFEHWLAHLLWHALGEGGRTIVAGNKLSHIFEPLDTHAAQEALEQWLALAMHQGNYPPLLPLELAYEYYKKPFNLNKLISWAKQEPYSLPMLDSRTNWQLIWQGQEVYAHQLMFEAIEAHSTTLFSFLSQHHQSL